MANELGYAVSAGANFQVTAAKETLQKISTEESSLKDTLSNIQDARPFEDLTVSSASPHASIHSVADLSGRRGAQGTTRDHQGCRDDDQEGQMDRARLPGESTSDGVVWKSADRE